MSVAQEGPGVRPNKSRIIAYVVRTVASANEIDHFHRTVAIAVIFRKIHDGVCRFHHHLTEGTRILQSFRVSAADINLDRTDNIKLRYELTKGIILKIVSHTSRIFNETTIKILNAGKVFLVQHLREYILGIWARKRPVVKLNQDDKATEFSVVVLISSQRNQGAIEYHLTLQRIDSRVSHFMTIRQALGRLCQKSFFLTATLVFIVSNHGRKAQGTRFCARRIYIIAMSVFLQRVAINSGYIMQELISTHLQRHDRTVWLHITIKRRICRNSHHFVRNSKEQSQRHDNG